MSKTKQLNIRTSLRQKLALIIAGLLSCIILLELGLRLGGGIILSLQESRNRLSIKQKGTYRIMCLGESTTASGSWQRWSVGSYIAYPYQLEEILNQRNIGITFSVINKGIIGTNTSFILSELEFNLNEYNPDMVITMMGVNDSGVHMPYDTTSASGLSYFCNSLRTYKLYRLLWLHMVNKFREMGMHKTDRAREDINTHNRINVTGLKEYYLRKGFLAQSPPYTKKGLGPGQESCISYVETGKLYKMQHKIPQAEEAFKKSIALCPYNSEAYIELGRLYKTQLNLFQAEDAFNKAIELDLKNSSAYIELGKLYDIEGEWFIKPEWKLKQELELNPSSAGAYVELSRFYRERGQFTRAEQVLEKSLLLSYTNDGTYCELGKLYRDMHKTSQAEEAFKKAIEISLSNTDAYCELGKLYRDMHKTSQAEEAFKKAVRVGPPNPQAHFELGCLYSRNGKFSQAEEAYKKTIELEPGGADAYFELSRLYKEQGKLSQAEDILKKAIALRPKNFMEYAEFYFEQGKIEQAQEVLKVAIGASLGDERFFAALANLYRQSGKPGLMREYYDKARELVSNYYNPLTVANYRKLKKILERRKIKLVCAQYPLRSIEPLKRIFTGEGDIVFVDNEIVFKEALSKARYSEYFNDMFAGDFGHCTVKGNRLLAENIANTILKEVFKK